MRKIFFGFIVFTTLFLAAGLIGYHFYPKGKVDHRGPDRIVDEFSKSTPPEISSPITANPVPGNAQAVDAAASASEAENDGLYYLGWEPQDMGDQAKACFGFSERLQDDAEVALKSYVQISPKTPFSLDVTGTDLCVLGLDYAKEYEISLLPGLTARNGLNLAVRRDVSVSFGDKPAYINFVGDGIILPKTKQGALAIQTMNVEKVDVVISRVNHRILSQTSPNKGEVALEGEYSYGSDGWGKKVEIWTGDIEIDKKTNQMVTTAFDIQSKIADQAPGAYIVEVRRPTTDESESRSYSRSANAWRWIIVTDMALTSYRGDSGLTVSVRSIESAQLIDGVRLDLIAQNNEKLAELVTDGNGRSFFADALISGKGANAPKMIMAYDRSGDYAILDLARSPLDISSLDVAGRETSGPLDIYAFTERGIYRPGETAHLTALVRDATAMASFDRPITLIIRKPNDAEVYRETISEAKAGGFTYAYDIPKDAPRGQWRINFEAEGLGTIKSVSFAVEDFVPQKLRLGFDVDDSPLMVGDERRIGLDAQFLYGAPGAELATEAEARIQLDPNPFPDFKEYSFGDVNETYREQLVMLDEGLTDETGAFEFALKLNGSEFQSSFPLRAFVTAGVAEPGGRFVRDSVFVPVRSQDSYVGFKPGFEYYASRNRPASISLIAVNAAGERINEDVSWTLVEEDYDYHWYRKNGRWRYRRDVRDIPVAKGDLSIAADSPTDWSRKMDYGRYRLDVETKAGHRASYGFGVGWSRGQASTDAPDRIQIGAPDGANQPGDMVTLSLKAPYAGEGDLVIASDRVLQVQSLTIPEGASEVAVKFDPDWGQSVYAMVTLYTPRSKARSLPKRAVGLTYLELNHDKQVLALDIQAPDKTAPRQTQKITVDVKGLPRGEKAYLTLAAIDEGILQLTKYKSPDAQGYFFAKKAFGLDIRDDYSRILDPFAALGATRDGGDSLGGSGLSVVPTKTVALFSGLVDVKNGKATVPLELPDFNGELRLMATAWSKSAVGSASQPIKVRDAVPANLALPRFLAPGDKAIATVSLNNLDGADGDYVTTVSADLLNIENATATMSLTQGQRDDLDATVIGEEAGTDELSLTVKGPNGYSLTSTYPIETRAPYRDVTRFDVTRLNPGEDYTLDQAKFQGFLEGSTEYTLSVDAIPGLTPAPFLAALQRYPYGCSEQTVSVAMPLVFVEELGGFSNMSQLEQGRQVQKAITRLVARQDSDGSFGLWRAGDGYASPWLQQYVTDFLLKANDRGFNVPDAALKKAQSAASKMSKMEYYTALNLNFDIDRNRNGDLVRAERAAYAHYNLTQAGQGQITAIRYVHDEFGDRFTSPVAQAHLAAALDAMGDQRRAKAAYQRAADLLGDSESYDYYSSDIRNAAAILSIAGNQAPQSVTANLVKQLAGLSPENTNTQENAYLVQAMAKLKAQAGEVRVSAKNIKLVNDRASGLKPSTDNLPIITNKGDKPVWVSLSVSGTPIEAPAAISEGFDLDKTLYTMDGKEMKTPQLKHGERAIILVEADPQVSRNSMLVISDLLPAGFEIETVLTPADAKRQDGQQGAFEWLGELTELDLSEARDDRYVASARTNRWWDEDKIRTAYIVRAVTAGEFAFPGAMVEDMYRPQRMARTDVTRLSITAAGSN